MKFLKIFLLAGLLFTVANAQIDTTKQHYWMMTYFLTSQESAGAMLAFSSDSTGISWQIYNNGNVILVPTVTGSDGTTLMRDPMIQYDSTYNRFNFVWTVSWVGTTIGWDTSSNLTKWGPQVALSVGAGVSGCYCCWAPEIFWDDIKGQWQIIWSTATSSSGDKHIYYSNISGSDFTKFTPAQQLFYPGFTVIDADLMKVNTGKYMMVFKDERNSSGATQSKNVHYVVASQPNGPFKGPNLLGSDTVMSQACTNTSNQAAEGSSIIKQGNQYHLFFDPFNSISSTYRMVEVGNIDTTGFPWPASAALKAGSANFEYNHCNVIEVPRRYVMSLLYGKALPTPPPAPTLISPSNGAGGQNGSSILSWATSTGATGYNVQISTTATFAATLYGSKGGLATTSIAPGLSTAIPTYYWRVNAANANAGAGPWSAVWSFLTTGTSSVAPAATAAAAKPCDFSVANGTLSYSLKTAGAVEISFKDMLGRTTMVLNRSQGTGQYSIALNGYNLAAGRYIVRFKTAGIDQSAAVVLTR